MAIARVTTVQPDVLRGTVVTIEADISRGLHAFSVVGLASKAVDEAKDRVGSAIKHSGYSSPKTKNQKVIISLSPADLKKRRAVIRPTNCHRLSACRRRDRDR